MLHIIHFMVLLACVGVSHSQNQENGGLVNRLFDFRIHRERFGFDSLLIRNKENSRRKRQIFSGDERPAWLQNLFSFGDEDDTYLTSLFGCQDFEMPCPEWTEWRGGDLCSATCGEGVRVLRRYCENSSESNTCEGNDTMVESCNLKPCPLWSPWATITPCTKTCGTGQQLMKRICYSGNRKEEGCDGKVTKVTSCLFSRKCRSAWSTWSKMSGCSRSCGIEGTKIRTRTCLTSKKANCRGPSADVRRCNTYVRCPYAMLTWSQWSKCKAPCGMWSHVTRRRKCGTQKCNKDDLRETKICVGSICSNTTVKKNEFTVPGNYTIETQWSPWSICSTSCGKAGVQIRSRKCFWDSVANTRICDGTSTETRVCAHVVTCPTWEEWSEWSMCSKTCGKPGDRTQVRNCARRRYVMEQPNAEPQINESPKGSAIFRGNGITAVFNTTHANPTLAHDATQSEQNHLPEDIQTSESNTTRLKRGIFTFPRPQLKSAFPFDPTSPNQAKKLVKELVDYAMCEGGRKASHGYEKCLPVNLCRVVYTQWSRWRPCSASCGPGYTTATRACYEGNRTVEICSGVTMKYRSCFSPPCWSQWSQYTPCTTSCGGGDRTRSRRCESTSDFIKRYRTCKGSGLEITRCNDQICPIWSRWSQYNACSVTCGGGMRSRSRECLQGDCVGDSLQSTPCAPYSCPEWSSWGKYSTCDRCCGGGLKKRERRCSSSFAECLGSSTEEVECNTMVCNARNITADWSCGVRPKVNRIQQRSNASATLLIFGGVTSVANTWPWMASLQVNRRHFCGATLISPRWVLSAAHCYSKQVPISRWSVVLGAHFFDKPNTYTRANISGFYPHLEFSNRITANNDIMMIKLKRDVPSSRTILPSCLPNQRRPRPNETCFVMGWGSLTASRGETNSLQEAAVPVLDHTECQNLGFRYRRLNRIFHMCAGDISGEGRQSDTCTGDSGGPLMCRGEEGTWYIAGVTSFGFLRCGTPGHPGIYAPVASYETWIQEIMRTC